MSPKKIDSEKSASSSDYYSKIKPSPEKINSVKRIGNTKPVIYIGMGTCGLAAGAQATYNTFQTELSKYKIEAEIIPVGCLGACYLEPIVDIKMPGKTRITFKKVTSDKVAELVQKVIQKNEIMKDLIIGQHFQEGDTAYKEIPNIWDFAYFVKQKRIVLSRCGIINSESLDDYLVYDGYKALAKVLEDANPAKVVDIIKQSGLRGRGGAGFPTWQKWQFCRDATSPDGKKYVIVNADEGDPGAFMNRLEMESDPFAIIEGLTIMGYAVESAQGYIYCRAEKPLAAKRIKTAIEIARQNNFLGKNILGSNFSFDIDLRLGAGAFVCGEETAMLESIEGKRGMPRIKPPYPATYGLFGRPTVINNVESVLNVGKIIVMGPTEFVKVGCDTAKGTKVFSLTGKITNPGLVEVPLGTTVKQVIEIGGGVANKKKYKAAQIGGPSGGCIPIQLIDTPIDYDSLKKVGAMMGSGGLVIMDEDTCMVDTARFFMNFIQEESCGKCIPCREGTRRMLETLEKIVRKPKTDLEVIDRLKSVMYLDRLANVIKDSSLCGLGQSAPNPVLSTLQYFRDEYEAHLYEDKCPAKYCGGLLEYKINVKACTGCGLCKLNCPNNAIVGEKKSPHYIVEEKCIRCGLCKQNCKFEAVNVE
jgi:NADH:ubiquinone oxidoreductase subunit F (NADH-binding)/(2Fe-2S) ferredoxin/Pyruvate/2-oxoacid:ferredoxin oxidoreductase delta subunit